jgi:hypothetical protein
MKLINNVFGNIVKALLLGVQLDQKYLVEI